MASTQSSEQETGVFRHVFIILTAGWIHVHRLEQEGEAEEQLGSCKVDLAGGDAGPAKREAMGLYTGKPKSWVHGISSITDF